MTTYLDVDDATPVDTGSFKPAGAPSITVLANGNYVVAWQEQTNNSYFQVHAADGSILVDTTALGGLGPNVAALADGGFVVLWTAPSMIPDDSDFPVVHAQTFDANGTATGASFLAAPKSYGAVNPHAVGLAGGGFVVEWQEQGNVFSQVVDASNTPVGSQKPISSAGSEHEAAVAALTDGSFVYAVSVLNAPGAPASSGYNIYMVHQATNGTLSGLIAPEVNFTGNQDSPSIVGLAAGGYAVAWHDSQHVYVSVYNSHDQSLQQEIVVNSSTTGAPNHPELAATPDGGFVMTWFDGREILSRTYNSHGNMTSGETLVSDPLDDMITANPAVAVNADGETVFAWNAGPSDVGAPGHLYTQVWHPTNNLDGNQSLSGTSSANVLNGGGGDDRIEGGLGNDTLDGGTGNDTLLYYFSPSAVTVSLAMDGVAQHTGGEGTDTYNFENLIGSAYNDTLYGNIVANIIAGGKGADTMHGGGGDDTYYVDNAGDVVSEQLVSGIDDGGIDAVISTVTFTLPEGVENLTLRGFSDIDGTGNSLDNVITASNEGFNTLRGMDGNDTLIAGENTEKLYGGAGNDSYYVLDANEYAAESTASHSPDQGGIDEVFVSLGSYYSLSNYIENLTKTGTGNFDGTGNALDNIITGNIGNDLLYGGLGADTLRGGAGNDTYGVDNVHDVVDETFFTGLDDGGIDKVDSTISYTLGALIENLTLTGPENHTGTGNALNNQLTGNSGHNTLRGLGGNDLIDGGTSSDVMYGGAGNDTYMVDATTDKAIEDTISGIDDGGTDLVMSKVNFNLGNFVENLTLTGTDAINGGGNSLDNILTGNSAVNTLKGNGGNDTLDGGLGADLMYGGAGNDTYYVDNASDKVSEAGGAGTDTVYSSINLTLGNNVENLVLMGHANIGGRGNALDNTLTGNDNKNYLTGLGGNDTLTGGAGNDVFTFSAAAVNGLDHLTDFTSGGDDLRFTGSDYGFAAGHVLTSAELQVNLTGSAVGTNDQFIYNTLTHTLYWDSDGTGATAAIAIAAFDNGSNLVAKDFLFI